MRFVIFTILLLCPTLSSAKIQTLIDCKTALTHAAADDVLPIDLSLPFISPTGANLATNNAYEVFVYTSLTEAPLRNFIMNHMQPGEKAFAENFVAEMQTNEFHSFLRKNEWGALNDNYYKGYAQHKKFPEDFRFQHGSHFIPYLHSLKPYLQHLHAIDKSTPNPKEKKRVNQALDAQFAYALDHSGEVVAGLALFDGILKRIFSGKKTNEIYAKAVPEAAGNRDYFLLRQETDPLHDLPTEMLLAIRGEKPEELFSSEKFRSTFFIIAKDGVDPKTVVDKTIDALTADESNQRKRVLKTTLALMLPEFLHYRRSAPFSPTGIGTDWDLWVKSLFKPNDGVRPAPKAITRHSEGEGSIDSRLRKWVKAAEEAGYNMRTILRAPYEKLAQEYWKESGSVTYP